MEYVVLVDQNDKPRGTMEKMEAHVKGELHRAFSVFIFNEKGEMLLQRRALSKYHSPGLWTNSCCSHPRENEETLAAAHRRLEEELGFDTPIREEFSFVYHSDEVGEGLIEHEFDHVFTGTYQGEFNLNPEEVDSVKWIGLSELDADIEKHPEQYTVWFKIAWKELRKHL